MLKKHLSMWAGFFLLTLGYLLLLLPILLVRDSLEQQVLFAGIGIWCLLTLVSLVPTIGMVIRKSWFFPGSGEPIVLDLLTSLIQEINHFNSPVKVRKTRHKLIVLWRINEEDWRDKLERKDVTKLYELHLKFDNITKTVTMSDRFRSARWDYLSKQCSTGWFAYPWPFFNVDIGKEWDIANFESKNHESYTFVPEEIKSPVFNTILKNGWNARFSIF